MKKIISLFCRNYDGDHLVRDEIVPGAEWVVAGEGVATRKWDGTAVMVRAGRLFKRYDAKVPPTQVAPDGRSLPKLRAPKPLPEGFEPTQEPDPITGHWPGWVPVGEGPEDQWFRAAFEGKTLADGTYELCGPKFQGNPERLERASFVRHGALIEDAPRALDALKAWFATREIEGVVWHHPDGRMVKIKRRDFGLPWPVKP